MTERDRIMDAFRNCITEPKCKDCPWIECEEFDNRKIEIPADLALAVMRVLTIDAVPVEWLLEWQDEVGTINEWWPIIERIITVWREEQEAR